MRSSPSTLWQDPRGVTLVYELLDAHDDTARLAAGVTSDPAWSAHLDYLRRLQRVGREMMSQASQGGQSIDDAGEGSASPNGGA
jgi:hypothetical protein